MINVFSCSDRQGPICLFVDLPGYGYARMSKAQQMHTGQFLRQYLEDRGALRAALLLVDARLPAQASDLDTATFLQLAGVPYWVVATKIDQLKKGVHRDRQMQSLKNAFVAVGGGGVGSSVLPCSSVTGEGKRELWAALRESIIMEKEEEEEEEDDDGGGGGDDGHDDKDDEGAF